MTVITEYIQSGNQKYRESMAEGVTANLWIVADEAHACSTMHPAYREDISEREMLFRLAQIENIIKQAKITARTCADDADLPSHKAIAVALADIVIDALATSEAFGLNVQHVILERLVFNRQRVGFSASEKY